MIFFDTESIGFYGPTILIQSAVDDSPPTVHNIWTSKVYKTLELIETIVSHSGGVVGFNLTHDWYHFSRTYGVLKQLPLNHVPDPLDYADVEGTPSAHDDYCLKPVKALDLMLHGRKNDFQSTLKQKDIVVKKIPTVLSHALVYQLGENVKVPDIYFSKTQKGYYWRIVQLDEEGDELSPEDLGAISKGDSLKKINQDFVNLRLHFSPSTALKIIIEKCLGRPVVTLDDLDELPHPEEHGWWPCYSGWTTVFRQHLWAWSNDKRRLKYAADDVVYTRMLYEYFGKPQLDDTDSILACAIGAMYWHGFAIDDVSARKRLTAMQSIVDKVAVNINAPKQCVKWLHEVATPLEKMAIPSTEKEVLLSISSWKDDAGIPTSVATRAQQLITARQAFKEVDLLTKLIVARRFYVTYKVIGTKSNRMSGGSESYLRRGGSINPQGIKKGEGIRSIFTLAYSDMALCGGDFDGFEVSIAEAVYKDPGLREDLMSGKKVHGLFGAAMYNMSYEDIMATSKINDSDPNGYYGRAKKGFFATLYGAMAFKLSQALRITEEEAEEGLNRFFLRYPGIKAAQERIINDLSALSQPDGIGSEVKINECKDYVESIMGFKRYFSLELSIIKALFKLAQESKTVFKDIDGSKIKVQRRDRVQTATGAISSALYAAAFNLQSSIIRAGINHEIQSPGGEITKEVQRRVWDIQPSGVSKWLVMPMNIHDEIECPCSHEVVDKVATVVNKTVTEFKNIIPLIAMEWKTNLNNWGEK